MAEPYRSATTRATEEVEESACKPDPVHPPRGGPATISLSACAPRRCSPAPCGLPGSSDGPPSNAPCLALLRVGLAEPARSPAPLVSSHLTVSPLPRAANRAPAVCFLLRLREVAPAWVSPAPCPSESGLSSTDPKTIELLTDAINVINEQVQQQSGRSGSSSSAMEEVAFLMRMMAQDGNQQMSIMDKGKSGGGSQAGGGTDQRPGAGEGDASGKGAEHRAVQKATGFSGQVPTEFREALESYFNALEAQGE